jgi:sulfane dehydrogenase subunit SoxC
MECAGNGRAFLAPIRARDEAGNEQPVDPPWSLGGYANNAVQRVPVTVRP